MREYFKIFFDIVASIVLLLIGIIGLLGFSIYFAIEYIIEKLKSS